MYMTYKSGRRLPISWAAVLLHHRAYRSVHGGSIVNARTRIGHGCSCILPVHVFLLRLPFVYVHFLTYASRLSGNCSPPMLAIRESPIALGSPPSFLVSSIASRYSICTFGEATRPIFALLSSCLQSRSNQAIHGCILLHLPQDRETVLCLGCKSFIWTNIHQ